MSYCVLLSQNYSSDYASYSVYLQVPGRSSFFFHATSRTSTKQHKIHVRSLDERLHTHKHIPKVHISEFYMMIHCFLLLLRLAMVAAKLF